VLSLTNLKWALLVEVTEPILQLPITNILLETNLGVMVTDNPVMSVNVVFVVVKVSVLVALTTCKIAPVCVNVLLAGTVMVPVPPGASRLPTRSVLTQPPP
jgi:hypothetical protein